MVKNILTKKDEISKKLDELVKIIQLRKNRKSALWIS